MELMTNSSHELTYNLNRMVILFIKSNLLRIAFFENLNYEKNILFA